MRAIVSGIAMLVLAGCATVAPKGEWKQDAAGGFMYCQTTNPQRCSYAGPEAVSSPEWPERAGRFLDAADKALNETNAWPRR